MRLNTSQQLHLSQEMKLSPRIIQAMEILQLPILALQERIEAELQSNPVLELRDPGVDDEAPPARDDEPIDRGEQALVVDNDNGQSEDFNRLADFESEYGQDVMWADDMARTPAVTSDERDRKLDAMANTAARGESLNEYLLDQWTFVEAPKPVKAAGERIITNIDAGGYLRTPLEDLAAQSPPMSADNLNTALKLVQTLEPTGIGARDLTECLLLQLQTEAAAGRDVSLEMELVRHFLRDIEMNHLPQIVKRTGRSLEEVKAAIGNLGHLNPSPGRLIDQRTAPTIRPDIIVELDENGHVIIHIPEGDLPHLVISRMYRRMLRDKQADAATRSFVRKNVRSAEWLIDAILQRRRTVRRVAEEVFAVQKDFLTHGPEALKPLPMADVARKVGVHVATVSRAVAGKYVQTPRGIFPLRMFFTGGTKTAEGEDVAWDAVKAKLREIIDAEDKSKPLSDDDLAAELQKHGIQVARRTVAKYRGLMDIPPARKRRQY